MVYQPSAVVESFCGDFCGSQLLLPSSSCCKWRRSSPSTWLAGSRRVDQSASLCGARDWWYTPTTAAEWVEPPGISEYDVLVTSSRRAGVLADLQDEERCADAWRCWLNDDAIAILRFASRRADSPRPFTFLSFKTNVKSTTGLT